MGICYIVAAMKSEYIIRKNPEDIVIAADAGYEALNGVLPDEVVGDFDSLGYIPKEEHLKVYPSRKDDTDMMIAVKLGLEKGYKEFVLIGGLGGRLDHTVANIQVLAYLLSHGAKGMLRSKKEDVYLIENEEILLSSMEKDVFSVFCYGEKADGVCISGAEYELKDAQLFNTFPLGVSNCFAGKDVRVSVADGRLLVIHEKGTL